jgi:hypothetical protein
VALAAFLVCALPLSGALFPPGSFGRLKPAIADRTVNGDIWWVQFGFRAEDNARRFLRSNHIPAGPFMPSFP